MNKIIRIDIDDIIIDPAAESQMISEACGRQIRMHVTGLCQSGNTILVICEIDKEKEKHKKYILAPFDSINIDKITAEITARYFAGFTTIGTFDVKNKKWGLFEHHQD